jgi:hypothetical protein
MANHFAAHLIPLPPKPLNAPAKIAHFFVLISSKSDHRKINQISQFPWHPPRPHASATVHTDTQLMPHMEKHNTTPLHRTTAQNQSIFTKIVRFSCHAKKLGFFVCFVPNRPLPLTPARARNRQYVRRPMANHCAAHLIPLPPKPLNAPAKICSFFR